MNEGEAKLAAMAAFVADPFLKFVVVVDHDVDIDSDTDVLHAVATRVRADQDVFMVPYAKGSPVVVHPGLSRRLRVHTGGFRAAGSRAGSQCDDWSQAQLSRLGRCASV
jgi:hypothetical protein